MFTVRLAVPLVDEKPASPAKLATIPELYIPALIPLRLTFESVATPLAFVVAFPTEAPLSVKVIGLPLIGELLDVSVADRVAALP